MSRHYLLDGYNILMRMPALSQLPLEDARAAFLKWIQQARPQGSVNNPVTVVFDGKPEHFGGSSGGEVKVIFSSGGSADELIKHMVEEDKDAKNCVVVSDDKDVFLYARSLGARTMTVAAFISRSTDASTPMKDSKYIPLSRQEAINKELQNIWLKKKP